VSAALTIRRWQGHAGLAAESGAWEACLAAAARDPLCNSHEWTLAYARAFVPDADVLGWTLEDPAGPAAVLALRREPARGVLALRRALLVADGSFDSDYLEPPVRPGLEREAARLLLDAARREPRLEALVLAGLPAGGAFLGALRAELEARRSPRRERPLVCLSARLPDDFGVYLAGLKPRMRTKVRSALRAAEEQGARHSWCLAADELESALEDLFRLHALRWSAAGQPGSFADPRRRAFYGGLARRHLERGTLRLARLELGGRIVASQLGFLAGGRYYQIQEGFDPEHGGERVGIALRALGLQELIAQGVREYDFMAGDARHKRDWGASERPCVTLALPLARLRARAAYGLRAWLDRTRSAPGAPVDGGPATGAGPRPGT